MRAHVPSRTARTLGFGAVALVTALGACGDDSGRPQVTTTSLTSTTAVATTTTVTTTTTRPTEYQLQRGDTLSAVAKKFGVTVQALVEANKIADPDKVQAGQTITIPPPPTTVAPGSPTTTSASTPPAGSTPAAASTTAPASSTSAG